MQTTAPRWQRFKPFWIPFILLLAAIRAGQSWHLAPYSPTALYFAQLITGPFYQGIVIVYIGLLLSPFTTPTKFGWAGWWILDASLCTFIVSQGFKYLTPWPRPSGSAHGFPSGHTLFSFTLAWLMAQRYPRLAPLWFLLAGLVGWSRVVVGAHYAYQVYFGAAFGLILGYLITLGSKGLLLPRYARRKKQTQSA